MQFLNWRIITLVAVEYLIRQGSDTLVFILKVNRVDRVRFILVETAKSCRS